METIESPENTSSEKLIERNDILVEEEDLGGDEMSDTSTVENCELTEQDVEELSLEEDSSNVHEGLVDTDVNTDVDDREKHLQDNIKLNTSTIGEHEATLDQKVKDVETYKEEACCDQREMNVEDDSLQKVCFDINESVEDDSLQKVCFDINESVEDASLQKVCFDINESVEDDSLQKVCFDINESVEDAKQKDDNGIEEKDFQCTSSKTDDQLDKSIEESNEGNVKTYPKVDNSSTSDTDERTKGEKSLEVASKEKDPELVREKQELLRKKKYISRRRRRAETKKKRRAKKFKGKSKMTVACEKIQDEDEESEDMDEDDEEIEEFDDAHIKFMNDNSKGRNENYVKKKCLRLSSDKRDQILDDENNDTYGTDICQRGIKRRSGKKNETEKGRSNKQNLDKENDTAINRNHERRRNTIANDELDNVNKKCDKQRVMSRGQQQEKDLISGNKKEVKNTFSPISAQYENTFERFGQAIYNKEVRDPSFASRSASRNSSYSAGSFKRGFNRGRSRSKKIFTPPRMMSK